LPRRCAAPTAKSTPWPRATWSWAAPGASAGGSKVQINHLSAGRIPGGAQVERVGAHAAARGRHHHLGLNASDFQTARKVAQAINAKLGDGSAQALDGRTVQVRAPTDPGARVTFIAELEELPLEPPCPPPRW
jgi:flagellar P-ring protein precursor FlgI